MKSELIRTITDRYELPAFAVTGLDQFNEEQLYFIGSLLTMVHKRGKDEAERIKPEGSGPLGEIHAGN